VTARTASATLQRALCAAGLDWIVPDWPAPSRVGALATTRTGGISTGAFATMNLGRRGADDASALAENRRRLRSFLPSTPVWLDQVHGTAVATLTRESVAMPAPIADAAVTREPDVVCAILTADCLPVLFADTGGAAVGIAHAGWRGLAAGVLEATISALSDLGASPDRLVAWLGPAIGPARFEVGADVHGAFCASDGGAEAFFAPRRSGKWHADLYGLARRRLARAGVLQVSGGGFCTYTDSARFFSYRRMRDSGRMAAAVWLAPG
jgi:YfiH family protein